MNLPRLALIPIFTWSAFMAGAQTLVPPNYASCQTQNIVCYSPGEIKVAYGLSSLAAKGFSGSGQTILIVLPFGSPTIAEDLHHFDASYNLPDPTLVIRRFGNVPPFDPTNSDQLYWADRASATVEWAHAIAPAATIILGETSTDPNSVQGVQQLEQAEQTALSENLASIIVQPWQITENTLFSTDGQSLLNSFNSLFQNATTRQKVTFLATAGSTGSSNVDASGNLYGSPTVVFPASSPWVTAVGGTSLYTDSTGDYQYETVWNNSSGAGGGGVSQYFAEPFYQRVALAPTIQAVLKHHRGIPDVAYDADPHTGVPVYETFNPERIGFSIVGGTEIAAAQWGGIVAIANQYAGRPLGFLNPALYLLGAAKLDYFFLRDITLGNNAFDGIPGYTAVPGWDPASGWGTSNPGQLIPDLCHY